jgi:DNA-binding response OmpR family regulator
MVEVEVLLAKDGGIRVLVVEDDPDTAEMIKSMLERRFPAEVDIAGDGSSARKLLARKKFDLVTLDYNLPDCCGFDMLE